MTISKSYLKARPVYNVIADRLWKRHKIDIYKHIDIGCRIKIKTRLGEGIFFRPVDSGNLKSLLKLPMFAHDNRHNFCERLAALVTRGEGYREIGAPSLHFQISKSSCNIHLDSYGFVAIGPDGKKYYNPDLVQHMIDDLGWATVVKLMDKANPTLGCIIGRVHPILPNSRNRYSTAIGGKFVVAKGKGWSLGIDSTIALTGEKKTVANLEVLDW